MKRLLLILAILVAVLAAAWLAPLLIENPGYVLIDAGPWRLEMSLLVLAGLVAAVWIALSLASGLLRLPGRSLKRIRDARTRRHLDRGLLAMTEGDWARAEKSLAKALSGRSSTAGYLAAARAAQGQAAPERRDAWLKLADGRFGRRHFITGLARARLLAAEGRLAEAVPILEDLHLKKRRHPGVLRLLSRAYQDEGRWRDLRLLVPALRRAGLMDAERAESLASLAAARELDAAGDGESLIAAHGALGRKLRRRPEVVAALGRRALELNRPDVAESELRRAIGETFDADLVAIYGESDAGDRKRRIGHCRRWLEQTAESEGTARAALHLALGKLYRGERDFEAARRHLEQAVRERPDVEAYAALGGILDRDGELEAAAQCYRNALRLRQGRVPEPLPPPE